VPERILVVDDEPSILELVAYNLRRAGFEVLTADNGEDGLRIAREEEIDLVILDVMLPGIDGFEVLRALRRHSELPVLMLTARGEEIDRVVGFEIGADDYVTKPFSPQELVLRIRAVLRRAQSPPVTGASRILRGGPIVVDLNAMRVEVDGTEVQLTPTEYRLLVSLMERRGRVQSREQLLSVAWDIHVRIETRTVDMHVQRLRSKLGSAGHFIETVRGFGYRFKDRDQGA
jgi:DNA-binding response OmpR family regulator